MPKIIVAIETAGQTVTAASLEKMFLHKGVQRCCIKVYHPKGICSKCGSTEADSFFAGWADESKTICHRCNS